MSQLVIPDIFCCQNVCCQDGAHSFHRDSHVLDVMTNIIEASFETIPVSQSLPNTKRNKTVLPGWTQNVLPFKNDSLFWHSIWISMGKPNKGGVFDVMKHTRNKYHYAVRRAKRELDILKSEALAEAAAKDNLALFKEMKNHLFCKSSDEKVPDSLEGKVTHEDIVEKFRECYAELYNSADTSQEMFNIKRDIHKIISLSKDDSYYEVMKITPFVVKDAATLMKPNKADVSGSFTSDVFLNAPDILFVHLAAIFQSFVLHGTITKEILSCAFLPLYKGGLKDPCKFKSYRAIAGASQLLKLFEYVVLKLWGHLLTTDSVQFGFKPGVSTTQCSWLVMEVAQWYVQRGGVCQAAFLDCSMAFDKCLYSKLFSKMLTKNVPPIVVRALIFAYEEQIGWVRLAGKNSKPFGIKNATRQGSVLSPYLFSSCYLDDLLVKLRKLKLGCHVAGIWMGATAYADDLTLMAPDRLTLQRMISISEDYGKEHNLIFSTDPNPNQSKSKCVYFCGLKGRTTYPPPIMLEGKELPWVLNVNHLGHILHQSLSMEADSLRARSSFMSRASDIRDHLYFAHPNQRIQGIQLYCCDAYGSMLWEFNSKYSESFFKAWNVQARLSWFVPRDTHTNIVERFLCEGYPSLRNQVLSRYQQFTTKLSESQSKEIRFMFSLVKNDMRSVTGRNVNYLGRLCNINILKVAKWKMMELLPKESPCEGWRTSLLCTLLEARHTRNHGQLGIDRKQLEDMIISLCNS